MKHYVKKLGTLAALAAMPITSAFAAVPSGFGDALDGILADATSMATTVSVIVIGVVALGVGIKLIKRFGNKV